MLSLKISERTAFNRLTNIISGEIGSGAGIAFDSAGKIYRPNRRVFRVALWGMWWRPFQKASVSDVSWCMWWRSIRPVKFTGRIGACFKPLGGARIAFDSAGKIYRPNRRASKVEKLFEKCRTATIFLQKEFLKKQRSSNFPIWKSLTSSTSPPNIKKNRQKIRGQVIFPFENDSFHQHRPLKKIVKKSEVK